jgi:two-component system, cell cycle response regulator
MGTQRTALANNIRLAQAQNGPRAIGVLLVEDNPMDERLVRLALALDSDRDFQVIAVDTLEAGVGMAQTQSFDAIILDLHLPDSDGLGNVKQIALAAPHTPIVVLTSCDEDQVAIAASRYGAQNYLVKGKSDPARLSRYVRCAIAHKAFEAELAQRAHFDYLTGLVNRSLFEDRVRHALSRALRASTKVGVLFADVDNFKAINDAYGHNVGDEVICAVAKALRNAVRKSDTVARMGGDEFTILVEQLASRRHAIPIAKKIVKSLAEPVVLGSGVRIQVGVSIGAAVFPDDGDRDNVLLERADAAMLRAKRLGGNRLELFRGLGWARNRPGAGHPALSL